VSVNTNIDVDGQCLVSGNFVAQQAMWASNGAAGTPSISFQNDPDTGLYRIGDNQIGVAANGALRARIDVNGITSFGLNNQILTTDYNSSTSTGTNMQMALLSGTGSTSGKLEVYNAGGTAGGTLNINTSGGGAVNFGSGNATFGGNILLPQNGVIGKSTLFALQFGGADYGFVNTSSGHCVLFSNSAPTNALVLACNRAATGAGAVLNANGTAAAPSISFASTINTGFYKYNSNAIGFSAAGSHSLLFSANGYIYGAYGTDQFIQLYNPGNIVITAAGTNQNITLTPSGTGVTMLVGNNVSPLWLNKGTGAGGIVFSFNGTTYLSSITTSESSAAANCYMDLGVATGANTTTQQVLRLIGNGRALIGTIVDSGALLQVGTDLTTTANGMVFGTDCNLYRSAANALKTNAAFETTLGLKAGSAQIDGGGSLLMSMGGAGMRFYPTGTNGQIQLVDINVSTGFTLDANTADTLTIKNKAYNAAGNLAALAGTFSGVVTASGATATPAAGSTAARLLFGTTAGFGIYYGSGAPTVSAAQGSIYLRSDGSGTNNRLYVNTNGSTTWTNFVSAA
jgi:hypothetical protein